MTIVEKINQELKDAIRSRDQIRLNTLRMLKSKIMTVDARANLPDEQVVKLFKTYYNNLKEAEAQATGRPEIAEQLQKELAIIEEFLPKSLSREETKKIVEQAIQDSGAKTKRDLGQVMKAVMKLSSAVDGKLAKDLGMELLGD